MNATSNAMAAKYDLHLHTHWSYDASLPTQAHFARAAELGVTCLAITEHHHVDSMPDALQCALQYPQIHYVPAVELTLAFQGGEYDLLCYGLPNPLTDELQTALVQHHDQAQRQKALAVIAACQQKKIPLDETLMLKLLADRRPNHVVQKQGLTLLKNASFRQWLTEQGHIETPADYVHLMQSVAGPGYAPATEMIPLFRNAGAVIVLAHPFGYFSGTDEKRMDLLRESLLLDGIECAHPSIPREVTPIYEAYCHRHDLICTAGSDSHSPDDLSARFAMHGGSDDWLEPFLERLPR